MNFLIGGPNQSHKVNFKEPSLWERGSKKNRSDVFVNTFSEELFQRPCGEGTRCFFRAFVVHLRAFPATRFAKGGGNMRPAAGGTRLFCAIFSTKSLISDFEILGPNHLTCILRAHRPAARPPARSRAPISVSRIQLISGRVPTGLTSLGPVQPVSRARGPEPGLVDRAAVAWPVP